MRRKQHLQDVQYALSRTILYHYMEDYGYNYIYKLPQFSATMNSRNNRSIDMKPNHVKNSDFISILYSKPLREYKKPKFGIGHRIPISKYDIPFMKSYRSQFTREICEVVAIPAEKRPTYTIKDEQEAVIRGKFCEKELIRVIWVWILFYLSWFSTHIRSSLQTIRSVHLQFFCRGTWIWMDNGR